VATSPTTSSVGSPVTSRAPVVPATPARNATPKVVAAVTPKAKPAPEALDVLCTEKAELHLFDLPSGTFVVQDSEVTAVVSEVGKWQCKLVLSRSKLDNFN